MLNAFDLFVLNKINLTEIKEEIKARYGDEDIDHSEFYSILNEMNICPKSLTYQEIEELLKGELRK